MTNKVPFRISPMLATLVSEPVAKPGWVFEEKYDGVRMLAYKEGSEVSLVSRNAIDRTPRYPEIAVAIRRLKPSTLALDGEVVVFDAKRVSRFQLLQQGKGEPQYAIFDCLYVDGKDLRKTPLSHRREVLERAVRFAPPLLLSQRLAEDGLEAFKIAAKKGFEGIIAKDLSSPYVEGRSNHWLKVKVHQEEEFVIGGFTRPKGARKYFGSLLIGVYSGGRLQYVGKVGTGFNEEVLASVHRKLVKLVRSKSPFSEHVRERGATFVAPKLVAQISFAEWTRDGKLRQPVYLGLRDDKIAKEVTKRAGG
jgi:bifunctional non-homologous end joining protein LigD